MTRVSVVIPCFDMGEYLDEAVKSALAQTHDDLVGSRIGRIGHGAEFHFVGGY